MKQIFQLNRFLKWKGDVSSNLTDNLSFIILSNFWFGLVSLFNGITDFIEIFNAKAILIKEEQWYYLTHSWKDNGVHAFPKVISLKVNVIVWLEFKLSYFEATVEHFSHYNMEFPSKFWCFWWLKWVSIKNKATKYSKEENCRENYNQ